MFIDRADAGEKLGHSLLEYKSDPHTIIFALPRGGITIGWELAKLLDLPLDVICARKIRAPGNPEFAIGAVTDQGQRVLEDSTIEELRISKEYVEEQSEREMAEARARCTRYREGMEPRMIFDKRVIIADDGLATGATMAAAVKLCRAEKAEEIIVAVPVSSTSAAMWMRDEVDDFVCLDFPQNFQAVGQFYESFPQVDDAEVIRVLQLARQG